MKSHFAEDYYQLYYRSVAGSLREKKVIFHPYVVALLHWTRVEQGLTAGVLLNDKQGQALIKNSWSWFIYIN